MSYVCTARTGRAAALATVLAVHGAASPGASEASDVELGEHLSQECTSCHRPDAVDAGIPDIFGLPPVVFTLAMEQYRDGTRINAIMRNVARSLSDDEIAGLAAYLSQASP